MLLIYIHMFSVMDVLNLYCSNSVLFNFTYTIKIVFRCFTEAQGLTPNNQQW